MHARSNRRTNRCANVWSGSSRRPDCHRPRANSPNRSGNHSKAARRPEAMSAPEMPSDDLRAVIRDLATDDAAELLAEARRAARLRAQRVLEDAFVEELLEATVRRHRPSPEPVRAAPDDRPEADRPQSAQLLWTYCVLAGQDAIRIAPQLEGIEPGTQVEAVSV